MSHDPTDFLAEMSGWRSEGICAQTDPEVFFPEGQGARAGKAKRVCATCPVRAECLEFALDHHEHWGVWGGYSERERRAIASDADLRANIFAEIQVAA